jgi:hypothetical protein
MNTSKYVYTNQELKSMILLDTTFQEIINSNLSKIDYLYLSSNPTLNKEQIQYLFLQQIGNVNINLLRNINCPDMEIENFITLDDKIYNIAIAHNPNLKQMYINKLLKFNDKDVLMSLEFNNHV